MPMTTRREFLKTSAAAAAGVTLAGLLGPNLRAAEGAKRPNIVYFMCDDQAWHAMSNAGNPIVKTPHMDRLAREGIRFDRMFVTNSLCAPSRACFLTGKYSHTHGVRNNEVPWKEQPIFTDYLKQAGYQTCFIGKFHQGGKVIPAKPDIWMGFTDQGIYMDQALRDFDGTVRKETGHNTDILADRAVEYLKDHRKDPFCLLLWFKAPHRPWVPAERFQNLYADAKIERPKSFNDDYAGRPDAVKKTEMQVEIAKGKIPFDEWVKDYYRTLAGVDDAIGRVLKTLEDLKILDDTIIVHTSDNGFFLGEHHFFDKRLMYEPSIRVPMIIRYPRVVKDPGRAAAEMVLNVDLAPTLLELAGLPVPADMQGASWKPLLEGRQVPWRKSWYYEYYEYPAVHMVRPCRGVRTEEWKYIEWPEFHGVQKGPAGKEIRKLDHPAEYELYNLKDDPDEMKNLYGSAACAAKVEELRKEMVRLRAELKDSDAPAPAPA
jgi:arylsulfatase A-like enzyme